MSLENLQQLSINKYFYLLLILLPKYSVSLTNTKIFHIYVYLKQINFLINSVNKSTLNAIFYNTKKLINKRPVKAYFICDSLAARYKHNSKSFLQFKIFKKQTVHTVKKSFSYSKKILNFLKFYTPNKNHNFNKFNSFNITKRLFLSKALIFTTLWYFFFFKKKLDILPDLKKKKKLIFFNGHKQLLWKMRKARYAHWTFRTRGKLNKRRYDKLLGFELHKNIKTTILQFLSFIFFVTYFITLSWKQIILLQSYNIFIYNGLSVNAVITFAYRKVLELPCGRNLLYFNKYKTYLYKTTLKTSKFFYKKIKLMRRGLKVIDKNIKIPNLVKNLQINKQLFGKNITYDPSLNILLFIYPIPRVEHNINWKITNTSVLSLQNWRYNFN